MVGPQYGTSLVTFLVQIILSGIMDFGKLADFWPQITTTFHTHLESEHLFQLLLYADITVLQ